MLLRYYRSARVAITTLLQMTLLLSCLFSVTLTIFRALYTGQGMFLWLNWNLFLALVPLLLTGALMRQPSLIEKRVFFWPMFLAWLVFIPNSFYIITDLFHLMRRPPMPLWFDCALILSFAWNGLILGIVSMRQMETILRTRFSTLPEMGFLIPMMFLNALGVYIGRVLRYNSWDVLSNPFQLCSDIIYLLIHPLRNRFDWGMIICYAVLLLLFYGTVKKAGVREAEREN